MKKKPSIKSLENVSLEEAVAYLDHSNGDELNAAYALASIRKAGWLHRAPDDAEVHHALFLFAARAASIRRASTRCESSCAAAIAA